MILKFTPASLRLVTLGNALRRRAGCRLLPSIIVLKPPLDQPDDPFGYVGDTAGHRARPEAQRLLCDAARDLRDERKYRAAILFAISDVSSHNGTTQARRTMMRAFGLSPEAPALR
jgi:hypothetical protein